MSWSLFVSSVELSLLGCELLEGGSYFLLSLRSLAPNMVPGTADILFYLFGHTACWI